MEMKFTIQKCGSFQEESDLDAKRDRSLTSEQRLDMVEQLRLESGKLLYEYPAGFRKVFTVTRSS